MFDSGQDAFVVGLIESLGADQGAESDVVGHEIEAIVAALIGALVARGKTHTSILTLCQDAVYGALRYRALATGKTIKKAAEDVSVSERGLKRNARKEDAVVVSHYIKDAIAAAFDGHRTKDGTAIPATEDEVFRWMSDDPNYRAVSISKTNGSGEAGAGNMVRRILGEMVEDKILVKEYIRSVRGTALPVFRIAKDRFHVTPRTVNDLWLNKLDIVMEAVRAAESFLRATSRNDFAHKFGGDRECNRAARIEDASVDGFIDVRVPEGAQCREEILALLDEWSDKKESEVKAKGGRYSFVNIALTTRLHTKGIER